MSRVLWLEDQVDPDLRDLLGEANTAGHIVTCATDIAAAVALLAATEFDFFVVDATVPPGNDTRWEEYEAKVSTYGNPAPRLGIDLLRRLWNVHPDPRVPPVACPRWLTIPRVGILSVETMEPRDPLRADLQELGIPLFHYVCKTDPGDPRSRLRDLIQRLEQDISASNRCDG